MQNALKLSVAGIAAIVLTAAAVSHQPNNVPQQDAEYSAQTESAEDSPQSKVVPVVSVEEAVKHYSLEYCFSVNQDYQMLQQGYDVSAKRARIIQSEMQECRETRAAYEKKYPPGGYITSTTNAARF